MHLPSYFLAFLPCCKYVSTIFHTLYAPNTQDTIPFQDLNAFSAQLEAAAEAVLVHHRSASDDIWPLLLA